MNTKRVLLGSPVHQKPEILKEFLEGLSCLQQDSISIDYFFYDNNSQSESTELLKRFAATVSNTIIRSTYELTKYACDETTHYWNEELIWMVAGFKDEMISYAFENKYDFLFLIDSDILMEASTVEQLVASGRDIISEVFWTSWYPGSPPLPNVWFFDHYDMVPHRRAEKLSSEESAQRQQQFFEKLKKPGVYEVGMLGACTLLSRKALSSGISFKPVYNLSIWGEDRHFCIRAAALGFCMYADTHCKTFHIYRESALQEVEEFKVQAGINKPPLQLAIYQDQSCPVCEARDISIFHSYNSFKLFRCAACGLLFQSLRQSMENDSLIIKTYGPSWIQMRDQYTKDTFLSHAKFNNMLLEIFSPHKGLLLEIGSGTGEFLYMAKAAGWQVTGIEPGTDACKYAAHKFNLSLTCSFWNTYAAAAGMYDAVAFWHVLEHIADPISFLNKAAAALKPGGLIYFSLPNNDSLFNNVQGKASQLYLEEDHIMHYNRHNLSILLAKASLEPVALFARQEPQCLEAICSTVDGEVASHFEKLMALSARLQAEFKGYELVCIARRQS